LSLPKEGKYWTNKRYFLKKLIETEKNLNSLHKFTVDVKNKDCLLCDMKNIATKTYKLNKTFWENSLKHYVKVHNMKPPQEYIEMIYTYDTNKYKPIIHRINGQYYSIGKMNYIKLDAGQILILDALLKHGGYDKKYPDKKNKKIYRYSEHAGLLDFNNNGLERIIVSGNSDSVDKGDDEIYLPKDIKDIYDYEYMFHTHPPTPKPGGRAADGLIYEFPSGNDIIHFLDHFNRGLTQGSIVITPEGFYNIHKFHFDKNKIKCDENDLYNDYIRIHAKVQSEAIKKHGTTFSTYYFYSVIAQDTIPIKTLNKILKIYDLYIDYFPRHQTKTKKWIIDTVFLPIYIIEPVRGF
jgi:hypothetical protein